MSNPICLSPLKFYDALEKQERYKSYAYGQVSPVVMPFNIIYPFQFVANDNATTSITSAYIYDANTNEAITNNVVESLKEDGLSVKSIKGYRVVLFPGIFPTQELKFEGQYYLGLVTDKGEEYYSEVFCFTHDYSKYIEIEYWHPEFDFIVKNGIITFADNFHFKMLINSELGRPEYSFEEEATKRLGYNFIESQTSKKTYKFNAILPEYQCDAIRLVRMCSNKKITSLGETYDMLSFDMNVDWQEQGNLASVTCEFEVDNIIVNTGTFMSEALGGDFNNDYNNDLDNE
jgi:hypothetical protein